jgi:hypothetical protein
MTLITGWDEGVLEKVIAKCNGGPCPEFTEVPAGDCRKKGNSPDLGNGEVVSAPSKLSQPTSQISACFSSTGTWLAGYVARL